MTEPTLVQRVRSAFARHGPGALDSDAEAPLLVAVSGGRDSLVLLHLLRFGCRGRSGCPAGGLVPRHRLHALHVEHGMRGASGAADARWLQGLARGWQVPLRVTRAPASRPPPRTEDQARRLRYEALREEAARLGATFVLLAHHAEDQAETVLFRLLRGTGPRGLAGIPEARPLGAGPGSAILLRPLLEAPGAAMEGWATATGLRPREDPTNRDPVFRRNWIRHHLLPRLEAEAPGTRDVLLALAREARGREAALASLLEPLLRDVVEDTDPGWTAVARDRFLLYPEPIQGELLRALLRGQGGRVSRRGLALALRFASRGEGGREVTVAPGVRLARRQNRLDLRVEPVPGGGRSEEPSCRGKGLRKGRRVPLPGETGETGTNPH